ncbi:hypothetical protein BGL42_04235 [Fructilactobacillus sanfranciscensis]|nr:hypothetical protein [Fructilactobacillus sanfranciscensis]POH14100.1 hypothetical protein BGL42_04235 [Fructilactobacillus sanfranciscensis]
MVLEAEAAFHLLTVTELDIQFLHEPGNLSWTAPKLQWLKFQIQFMVDLHNAVSLLEFRKDPQNPLFQVRIFGPAEGLGEGLGDR